MNNTLGTSILRSSINAAKDTLNKGFESSKDTLNKGLKSNTLMGSFILFLVIGYIIYYGWFFTKILDIDQQLTTSYLSESSCERSPLEIETVRYTMKEYMNQFPSIKTHHILHAFILTFAFITIVILKIKTNDTSGIPFLATLILCTLFSWIVYPVNDLSINDVLIGYRTEYNKIKEFLQSYFQLKNITSVAQFPEPFLKRLVQRYRTYHEATNYLRIPIYSEYEIRNELTQRMEETITNPDKSEVRRINVDELMRFIKFNYDVQGTTSVHDIELLTGMKDTDSETIGTTTLNYSILYSLRGNTYNVKPSMDKQLTNIKIVLWIIMILITYPFFHMFYQDIDTRPYLVYGTVGMVFLTIIVMIFVRFSL